MAGYTDLLDTLVSAKDKSVHGTFQSTNGESGTYTLAVTHEANGTVDKVMVYTNAATGKSETIDTVFTELSSTQVTSHTIITTYNGGTATQDRAFTLNSDGTIAVTGDGTNAKGGTSSWTSTITQIPGGCDVVGTITLANGATGNFNDQATHTATTFDKIDTMQLVGQPPHTVETTGTILHG